MAAAYESFRYIYKPEYECPDVEVLTHKYRDRGSLGTRFVVYTGTGYRVYDDMETFLNALDNLDAQDRIFHEVIFSGPQKLKFDVDAPVEVLAQVAREDDLLDGVFDDVTDAVYAEVLNAIIEAVDTMYFATYLHDCDMIICESKGAGPVTKYSNHIIIDGAYVSSHIQAAEFTQRVKSVLAPVYWPFLDFGVNKRTQNFRIESCRKIDSDRVKSTITAHSRDRTLVTNIAGCKLLADIAVARADTAAPIPPDDIDAILRVCALDPDFAAHRFKGVGNGATILFERIAPSRCAHCKNIDGSPAEHTRDDTMYVWAPSRDGVTSIHKYCRRYTANNPECPNRRIRIGEILSAVFDVAVAADADPANPAANPAADADPANATAARKLTWLDKQIASAIKADISCPDLFTRPGSAGVTYSEPTLRPFERVPTLVVRAAMKMGKTKALAEHIAEHYPAIEPGALGRDPVIRFVSFRQTFSANIKEKFPDFTLYSDVRGPLSQARLIVQVESLHRLYVRDGSEPPDLLVLDECESIFEQFDSGLLRGNFNQCWGMFRYLLAYSKHVICMDANVGDRTYRILQQIRGDATLHWCKWQNATDDRYHITGDKLRWLGMLYANVDADEKIVIPSSSLAEAKVICRNLMRRYPDKTIRLYSSETLSSEKREHFANVSEYWSQCDVLIYTPTVSAGVSFELAHFSRIFGYFTDQSCPVETCLQMIGRIRDVSAREYHICLAATGNNLPVDVGAIRTHLFDKRRHLACDFDATGLVVTIGPDGNTTYTGDFLTVWLENTRMKNISSNSFVRHFIALVRRTGAVVSALTEDTFVAHTGQPSEIDGALNDELIDIEVDHKMVRGQIREEDHDRIASAPELSLDSAEEIRAKMVAQQDVSTAERAAYNKHRLRVDYRHRGAIDSKFVAKYADGKVRRQYKNLSRIYGDAAADPNADIDTALERIRVEELATHKYFLELGETAQASDIVRKYVFEQHRYALGLLRLCGWTGLDDQQMIHANTLTRAIDCNTYWTAIQPACTEFRVRRPSLGMRAKVAGLARVQYMLRPINNILAIMYGVNIKSRKADPSMFYLTSSGLFTLDREAAARRNVPLIGAPAVDVTGFDDEPAPVQPVQPADELEEWADALLDI